jgi:hypothetical protein
MDVPCELGEHRYITKDTPDIQGTFECIARVGTWGNNANGRRAPRRRQPQLNAPNPLLVAATQVFCATTRSSC